MSVEPVSDPPPQPVSSASPPVSPVPPAPRRTLMVHTYLSAAEKRQISEKAAQLRVSVSDFLRRLALNTTLPSATDFVAFEAVRSILKVNADQARLGNALLLELDVLADDDVSPAFISKIDTLHNEIRQTQGILKSIAVEISTAVRNGNHART